MGNSSGSGRVLSIDTTVPADEIHGELISSGYFCDICQQEIYLGTSRMHCITCSTVRRNGTSYSSFDMCSQCWGKDVTHHGHKVRHCKYYGSLLKYSQQHGQQPGKPGKLRIKEGFIGIGESVWRRLSPLDGVCLKKQGPWHEYPELLICGRLLQAHWNKTLPARSFVLIFCDNGPEWVVSDFACGFSGFVSVPVAVTTHARTLGKILAQTECVVAVCDEARVPILLDAMRDAESNEIVYRNLKQLLLIRAELPAKTGKNEKLAGDLEAGKEQSALDVALNTLTTSLEDLSVHFWDRLITPPAPSHTEAPFCEEDFVPIQHVPPGDLMTLIFSSGSTGTPKAIMITNEQLVAEFARDSFIPVDLFAYEPLPYATQRFLLYSSLSSGGHVTFFSGNMPTFFDELKAAAPSNFSAPPRIWNILYAMYKAKVELFTSEKIERGELTLGDDKTRHVLPIQSRNQQEFEGDVIRATVTVDHIQSKPEAPSQFESANAEVVSVADGESKELPKFTYKAPKHVPRMELSDAQREKWNRKKLRAEIKGRARLEIRQYLGPNIRSISTGGAPTSEEVWKWMQKCFSNCHVNEGYGASEVGAIATNGVRKHLCDVHLDDVPELGYFTNRDKSQDSFGLLWVKGPRMTQGYFKDQVETQANFCVRNDIDGAIWYNTGDIVRYNPRMETLRVIDRFKNITKLSQSQYVCPEYLENIFVQSPFVENIFIYADASFSAVTAVIIPNRPLVLELARKFNVEKIPTNNATSDELRRLYEREDINLAILNDFRAVAKKNQLLPHETPACLLVEPGQWTIENGMMTVSYKLARVPLKLSYGERLKDLYHRLHGAIGSDHVPSKPSAADDIAASQESTTDSSSTTTTNSEPSGAETDRFVQLIKSVTSHSYALCQNQTCQELGMDSVAILHLQSVLGDKFVKKIPPEYLFTKTLKELRALYNENEPDLSLRHSRKQRSNSLATAIEEWKLDSVLPEYPGSFHLIAPVKIQPLQEVSIASPISGSRRISIELDASTKSDSTHDAPANRMSLVSTAESPLHFFVTGGTGFLGSHVIQVIHARFPTARVHCLVRSKRSEPGIDRLKQTFAHFKLPFPSDAVDIVDGSLEQENFGLTEDEYKLLASRINIIIHAGCWVNGVLNYSALRKSNVVGTQECLRFAFYSPKLVQFCYVSTLSVGNFHIGVMGELDFPFPEGTIPFHQGYSLTKCMSEHLVLQAYNRGLPCCIVRPGTICGSSKTGVCNPNDFITKYFQSLLFSKRAPRDETRELEKGLYQVPHAFSMISVDYVAELAVGVSTFADGRNDISFASASDPTLNRALSVEIAEKLSLPGARAAVIPVYHCGGMRKTSVSLSTITTSANRALRAKFGGDCDLVKELSYAEWRATTFPTSSANSYSLSASQKARSNDMQAASRNPLFPLKHYFPLHGFPAQLDRFGEEDDEGLFEGEPASIASCDVKLGELHSRKNNHNALDFIYQFNLSHKNEPIRIEPSLVDDTLESYFRELLVEWEKSKEEEIRLGI